MRACVYTCIYVCVRGMKFWTGTVCISSQHLDGMILNSNACTLSCFVVVVVVVVVVVSFDI